MSCRSGKKVRVALSLRFSTNKRRNHQSRPPRGRSDGLYGVEEGWYDGLIDIQVVDME